MMSFKQFLKEQEQTINHAKQIVARLKNIDPFEAMERSKRFKHSVARHLFGDSYFEEHFGSFESGVAYTLKHERKRYSDYFKDKIDTVSENLLNNSEHNENGQLVLNRILHEKPGGPNVPDEVNRRESNKESQGKHWTWAKGAKGGFHIYAPSSGHGEHKSYIMTGHLPSVEHVNLYGTFRAWTRPQFTDESEIELHPTARLNGLKIEQYKQISPSQ